MPGSDAIKVIGVYFAYAGRLNLVLEGAWIKNQHLMCNSRGYTIPSFDLL
jgi:hypothetical protein